MFKTMHLFFDNRYGNDKNPEIRILQYENSEITFGYICTRINAAATFCMSAHQANQNLNWFGDLKKENWKWKNGCF